MPVYFGALAVQAIASPVSDLLVEPMPDICGTDQLAGGVDARV